MRTFTKLLAAAVLAVMMPLGAYASSLSLVATDMELAGAAVGSGDPGLFAQATGCDPFEETSIAEFGFGLPAGA